MAWNEPGNNNDKDPWGKRKNQDGPPDLDEIVKKVAGIFGGGKKGGGSGSSAGGKSFIATGAVILAALWAVSGVEGKP